MWKEGAYPSAVLVQRIAVRIIRRLDAASCVVVRAVQTVGRERFPRLLSLAVHLASVRCVQRHLIPVRSLVHRLHDVDFSVVGPVGLVDEPEGGPCPAAKRGVDDVEDEEALVVGFLGAHADGSPAVDGVGLLVFDFEHGRGGGRGGEVCGEGLFFVEVAGGRVSFFWLRGSGMGKDYLQYKTTCWVWLRLCAEIVKVVKECGSFVYEAVSTIVQAVGKLLLSPHKYPEADS